MHLPIFCQCIKIVTLHIFLRISVDCVKCCLIIVLGSFYTLPAYRLNKNFFPRVIKSDNSSSWLRVNLRQLFGFAMSSTRWANILSYLGDGTMLL